jgi:hypothetical protein
MSCEQRRCGDRTVEVDGVLRPASDSSGKTIHPTREGTRNFWRWFGASLAVDERGRPLVVFHGTSSNFDAFEASLLGVATEHPAAGLGFQFTSSREAAKVYADLAAGDRVIDAYLSMATPKRYTTRQFIRVLRDLEDGNDSAADLRRRLEGLGHDGIIAVGDEADGTHYIVFRPTQIKSATSNTGSYSRTDPRIADCDGPEEEVISGDEYSSPGMR